MFNDAGEAEIVMSRAFTENAVLWLSVPTVPVIVTRYVPCVVSAGTVTVNVSAAEAPGANVTEE